MTDNEALDEFVHGKKHEIVKSCPYYSHTFMAGCKRELCQMWDKTRNDCGQKNYPPIPYETIKVGDIIEQKPAKPDNKIDVVQAKTIYTTKGKREKK